jgi:hypothetical protein
MAEPLPRFLLCNAGEDGADDRSFVLHTEKPRFVVEIVHGGHGKVTMLGEGREDSPKVLRAVVEACAWFGRD